MKVWLTLLASLWLAACTTQPLDNARTQDAYRNNFYSNAATGFHLEWPDSIVPEAQSAVAYALSSNWRLDMRPNEPGRLVAGWVLRGSNEVTAARLRFGVSGDGKSFEHCLKPGGGGLATNQVMIGGRPFTHYQLQDAGMSHYLHAEAYRSRYQGRCYAIDLIINGTNPEVYDPPRTPPFTRAQAQAQLHQLLLRVEWLAPETDQ